MQTLIKRTAQLFLFNLATASVLSARTWTDIDGRTLEAEFIQITDSVVVLQRNYDRREFRIPFATLSQKDREYLKTIIRKITPSIEPTETIFPRYGLDWPRSAKAPLNLDIERVEENFETAYYHYRTLNFDFHSNVKLARKVVTEFAEIFEATLALVQVSPLNWNVEAPESRYQAYFYEHYNQFVAAGGIPGSAGSYRSSERKIYVRLDVLGTRKTSTSISLDGGDHRTLIHEITHQVQHEWLHKLPTWLVEGYAGYIERIPYSDRYFHIDDMALDLSYGSRYSILSPYDLLNMTSSEWNANFAEDSMLVGRQYYSAYLLTYYFMHLDGDGDGRRLWDFLRALEKANSREALIAAKHILLDGRGADELFKDVQDAFDDEGLDLEIF